MCGDGIWGKVVLSVVTVTVTGKITRECVSLTKLSRLVLTTPIFNPPNLGRDNEMPGFYHYLLI